MTASDDIAVLATSIHDVLKDFCTSTALHQFDDGKAPLDRIIWEKAAELGWLAIDLPEAADGLEMGVGATAALHEALGAHLAPGPFLATLAAGSALARLERHDLLAGLAAGERSIAIAAETTGADQLRLRDGKVTGATGLLLGDAKAALVAVPALTEDGATSWVLLENLVLTAWPCIDRSRGLYTALVENIVPSAVFAGEVAEKFQQELHKTALLGIAADSIGAAAADLAQIVSYLGTRQQFGKVLGSFQALKHRCAGHKIDLEVSRELLAYAITRADAADGLLWAELAKASATDMFAKLAEDGIQLHGGVGFTWEFDCHFFLRRAKLNQLLFGGSAVQLDQAAAAAITAARAGASLWGDVA